MCYTLSFMYKNLTKEFQALKVNATLYRQLIDILIYLNHISHHTPFLLVFFLGLCKIYDEFIGNMQLELFVTLRYLSFSCQMLSK